MKIMGVETGVVGVVKESGWKVKKGKEEPIQCSLVKSPTVFIEPIPKYKIELLMEKYPHQEWLGYLVGKISERDNYFVEDLSIPPHKEVSGASAEVEPFHIPEGCIGVIHSHNGMGAFHSVTDQDYVDKNFPVSVTVSKRNGELEFDTVSYQRTPCGKDITLKSIVKYVQPKPPIDGEEFLKEATENIDKGKKVYNQVQVNYGYPYGAFGGYETYPYAYRPHQPKHQKKVHGHQRGYKDVYPYGFDTGKGGQITQEELDEYMTGVWKDDKEGV